MKVINLEQKSPEWLAWRSGGIGASEASAIMGVSPWDTATTLWELKTGRRAPKVMNPAMLKGVMLEDMVLQEYLAKTGEEMIPICGEHDQMDFIRASYDGMNIIGTKAVEIKVSASTYRYVKATGQVPPAYFPQVQHQIMVADLDEEDFIVHNPDVDQNLPWDDRFALITVPRDQPYIDKLTIAEFSFWNSVLSDNPPAGNEFIQIALQYIEASAAAKAAKKFEEEVKERLIKAAPGDIPKFSGGGVTVTRFEKKGAVDYDKLLKDLGVDEDKIEQYRKKGAEQVKVTINEATVVKGD